MLCAPKARYGRQQAGGGSWGGVGVAGNIFLAETGLSDLCFDRFFKKKIGGIGTPGVRILGIGTPGVPTLGIGRGGTYASDLDFSRFAGIHGRVSSETLGISHKYHINIYGKGPVSI